MSLMISLTRLKKDFFFLSTTGLILTTSVFALPLALAAFPQRQRVSTRRLEQRFWTEHSRVDEVEFNRGI